MDPPSTASSSGSNDDNLILWIKTQKEASKCKNLKFFDTKVGCKFAKAYVVLCAFEIIWLSFTDFFAFYTAYMYIYMYMTKSIL